jgi:hypothetical protein
MKTKTRRVSHKRKKQVTRKKKRIPKNISLKNVNCSPKIDNKKFTCYSDKNLHNMRDIWNSRHPDRQINTNDSFEIWNTLKRYYSKLCNKESCWIRQLAKNTSMKKELLDDFSPESPYEWKQNPNEWLSSVDISEVMKQYERTYKCFEFIGPSPIDFDSKKMRGQCVWEELCNFNLNEQIKRGKTKIGIIFNTHPHYKSGEHWISLFINIKKGEIYFFDSAGNQVPSRIQKFVDRIKQQGLKLSKPIVFNFDQNYPTEHQYKNTECGIYSIFFIVHMLEDKITGQYLKSHILKDEYMEKFRKVYFNEKLME